MLSSTLSRFGDIDIGQEFVFAPDIDFRAESPAGIYLSSISCRFLKDSEDEATRPSGLRIVLDSDDIVLKVVGNARMLAVASN